MSVPLSPTSSSGDAALLPSISMVAPHQSWRRTIETQTDRLPPMEDPTAAQVQRAMLALHLSSRSGIEQARARDLEFLALVEHEMRLRGLCVERAISVVRDEASRCTSHLLHLEEGHWTHLQNWERGERRLAVLKQQRREAVEATIRLSKED